MKEICKHALFNVCISACVETIIFTPFTDILENSKIKFAREEATLRMWLRNFSSVHGSLFFIFHVSSPGEISVPYRRLKCFRVNINTESFSRVFQGVGFYRHVERLNFFVYYEGQ